MPYLGVAPNPRENREVDDISSGFNGGTTQFTLQSGGSNVSPGKDTAIIVSLGGVVQNPGTDYTIAASTITFTTAPASGLSFFGVVLAQSIDIETTADNTVTTAKIVDGAVTNAKVNASAAIAVSKLATFVNTNADNRVITGSGTANTLNGEADLTFDGNDLTINKTSGDSDVIIKTTTSGNPVLKLNAAGAGGHDISHDRSSNSLIFNRTGSAERMRIDSSGKVGIGTASPQYLLHQHVSDSGSNYHQFTNSTTGSGSTDGGLVGLDSAENLLLWNIENENIKFGTNNTERMRIDTSGNVGIGTTSPSAKFECVGDGLIKSNDGFSIEATTAGTTGKLSIIGVNNSSQIAAISRLKSISTDSSTGASAMTFETRTTGNAMVERMRILANGDIGIGTVNPTTGLHVNGTTRVTELLVNVASGHNGSRVHIQGHTTGSHTNLRCANSNGTQLFLVRNDNAAFFGGSVSKGSGSFFIDHPLPSLAATKTLRHSFIEGPQCDNIYRGKVTLSSGTASINIDTVSKMTEGTFVVLNRDVQCFTSNETSYTGVKGSVSGNILTITSEDNSSTDTISWMVVGERQDPTIKESTITDDDGYLLVEEDKAAE